MKPFLVHSAGEATAAWWICATRDGDLYALPNRVGPVTKPSERHAIYKLGTITRNGSKWAATTDTGYTLGATYQTRGVALATLLITNDLKPTGRLVARSD
jgi:hypothetical protein